AGRERRVYALLASLPYSGAQTAFFALEMTVEAFLEGHVRAFEWLGGVASRVRVRQPARGRCAPCGRAGRLESALLAPARPLRLPRDRVHAGDAAREGIGRGGGALSQDELLACAPLRESARARRAVRRLARPDLQPAPACDASCAGRRAIDRGARGAAVAAAAALRLVRAPHDPCPARWLLAPRRLLLAGAGAARARAGRAALRPRRGLDHAPRSRGGAVRAQLRAGRLATAADHAPRAARGTEPEPGRAAAADGAATRARRLRRAV